MIELCFCIYVLTVFIAQTLPFLQKCKLNLKVNRASSFRKALLDTQLLQDKYTKVPGLIDLDNIRPSITDKARTITHTCTSGTLCTTSVMEDVQGSPFGSYVDYVLDEKGWPVLLLSEQSLHTQNIRHYPHVSLFCQLSRISAGSQSSSSLPQTAAALSRVTVMGVVTEVANEELTTLKMAFTLAHPYADQIVDSPKFKFLKIKPQKIYFSGGFGVMATWVDVEEYETARPDVLAQEVTNLLARVNADKQGELLLLCKHFLGFSEDGASDTIHESSLKGIAASEDHSISSVRLQAIDRLGIDLRVKVGDFTDEYRLGFRHPVNSAEDAKSELLKLFQEAWERDNGIFTYSPDSLPPITKYAEDILRK